MCGRRWRSSRNWLEKVADARGTGKSPAASEKQGKRGKERRARRSKTEDRGIVGDGDGGWRSGTKDVDRRISTAGDVGLSFVEVIETREDMMEGTIGVKSSGGGDLGVTATMLVVGDGDDADDYG
ncbi:hypothetical protein Droror1_Dr00019701 [Drosera rotundifolia]